MGRVLNKYTVPGIAGIIAGIIAVTSDHTPPCWVIIKTGFGEGGGKRNDV